MKKKIFKKIITTLLVVVMVAGALPMMSLPAFAALESGTCGNDITWSLDTDTGVLTISGAGAMYNYYPEACPWYGYASSIKTVIIEKGVKSIGDGAFYNCISLTKIVYCGTKNEWNTVNKGIDWNLNVNATVQFHDYNDGTITLQPTCEAVGVKTYTCFCGDTYTETLSALGHYVSVGEIINVDSITIDNDKTYPFAYSNGSYTSTNKVDRSRSDLTITALYDCVLDMRYGVSSESNYDCLRIYKNGKTLVSISGEDIENKTLTIVLSAGDILKISYGKDSSVSKGSDCGFFEILSGDTVQIGSSERLPADQVEGSCQKAIACDECGKVIKPLMAHKYSEVITTQPTHTNEGVKTFTCVCGDTYIESIEILPDHQFGSWEEYDEEMHIRSCACGGIVLEMHFFENNVCTECGYSKFNICYGDINGDTNIDINDIILLNQYLAAYDYDMGMSSVEIQFGADCNADTNIDINDIILLNQYLAAFDYDTGSSSVVLGPKN